MKIRQIAVFCSCFLSLLLIPSSFVTAKQGVYCVAHSVTGQAWSPDGERLAVLTLHGVLIYDHDLTLIRIIKAPMIEWDHYVFTGPVWSPDGVWIVLPQRALPLIDFPGYAGWSIANTRTGELRRMQSPSAFGGPFIHELAWSPNNAFVLALKYETPFGLPVPFSELIIVPGVSEVLPPRVQRYENLHLRDIRWNTDHTITARIDGLELSFDADTLSLEDGTPVLRADWWVSNSSKTHEAAQKPDHYFYVSEMGGQEQLVNMSMILDSDGQDVVAIPFVEEIIWLRDDKRLIGVYSGVSHLHDQYPALARRLQGVVVNARTATRTNDFVLQAAGDIQNYAVSIRGDRLTLHRDDTWVELWNPLTEERLTMIDIPALPIADTC